MDLDQIVRSLESHQGKWLTVYNNKIIVADTEEKLRSRVPAACEARQIPAMVYGRTTWSNAVSTIVQSLAEKQPPADVLREEKQPESVVISSAVQDEQKPGFFARLFGWKRKKEAQRAESTKPSGDEVELVYSNSENA